MIFDLIGDAAIISFREVGVHGSVRSTSWRCLCHLAFDCGRLYAIRGHQLAIFAAFASLAVQIEGLIGSNGILPVTSWLDSLENTEQQGWYFPTLFWLDASDFMLRMVCIGGMVAAVLVFVDVFTRVALLTCYGLYLSLVVAGQQFTAYQWDGFLLEIGFLAILLTWGSGFIIFLYRWLIARFMLMGGIVKLASGDPSWAKLTALNYHYQTQPIPTPLAYYAYHFPEWFHKFCVAGVFFIELVLPFFVFMPRRFRLLAAWSFIVLQTSILLTGNYNFFNLLAILLCLFLFEDKDIVKRLPVRLCQSIKERQPIASKAVNVCSGVWAGLVLLICAVYVWMYHAGQYPMAPLKSVLRLTSAFSVVNNYGPFAVMTTVRPEIIVQGSQDGEHWQTYPFKYKPGDLDRCLGWNVPHQPRLDWQMWFAALQLPNQRGWFVKFLHRLQQGSAPVLALLADNPFAGQPPRYVRAVIYRYRFTESKERAETGNIWKREYAGIYWPAG